VRYEFIPESARLGAGGRSMLSVDGEAVAEGYIPKTQPLAFSGDEGVDVGLDDQTNVSPDYPQHGNEFSGTIRKVAVELK
jgi:arylsulfatase